MLTLLTECLYMGHTAVKYAPILLNDMQEVNIFFQLKRLYD